MSVDRLQKKIREMKNPSIVDMTATADRLPPMFLAEYESFLHAYLAYCGVLLEGLKDIVPAVRFRFANFSLYGPDGLAVLQVLLKQASDLGYYVLLDCVQILSPQMAQEAADLLFADDSPWPFDGLIVSTYIGSDGVKPFAKKMAGTEKSIYGVVRTGNKSAAELQDLLTGNRLCHAAAADLVNRLGEPMPGKCGYHLIGAVAGASSVDGIRTLRSKYSRLFLLLDGLDYPNANAKNCSYAFDQFGHGAAACAGDSIMAAWLYAETDGRNYLKFAVKAAERMRENLCKYIKIL